MHNRSTAEVIERFNDVFQRHELALDAVELLELVARRSAAEQLLLGRLEPRLELVEHREVAVDDVVDQRIQHKPGAATQELGLALGARADRRESDLGAMADGEDVIDADEDVDFADPDVVGAVVELDQFGGVQHRKQRIAVFLDLRPLMSLARILDRELVQAELLRHLVQLGFRWLEQSHPYETAGAMEVFADVGDRDVGQLSTLLVRDATDEHEVT